jgi:hypothetical protein
MVVCAEGELGREIEEMSNNSFIPTLTGFEIPISPRR